MQVSTSSPLLMLVLVGALAPQAIAEEPAVDMQIDRIAEASPEEMRDMATEGAKAIEGAESALQKLDQTTRGKGAAKEATEGLDCVVDNLSSVRLLKGQAGTAQASMEAALAEQRTQRAASELRKIAVAASQSENLKNDAERCALGVTSSKGASKTTASGGVGDPDDDIAPPGADVLDFTNDGATKSPL